MKLKEQLAKVPVFEGLTELERENLAAICDDLVFEKGQLIFSEGDEGNGFYVVLSGRIKIFKLSIEGKEQILHLWEAGEPFGEVALFSGRNFPAYAEAHEKSRVLYIRRESFAALIAKHPSLALNMLGTLSMRLHKFADLIESLSLKEVSSRMAAHFIELSEKQEDEKNIQLDLAKGQLASLLGTIPETLSRTLKRMTKQGLIKTNGPEITIIDMDGLEDLAEDATKLKKS